MIVLHNMYAVYQEVQHSILVRYRCLLETCGITDDDVLFGVESIMNWYFSALKFSDAVDVVWRCLSEVFEDY